MGKNVFEVEMVIGVAGILATVIDKKVCCMLLLPPSQVKNWQHDIIKYERQLYACIQTAGSNTRLRDTLPEFRKATKYYKSEFSSGKSAIKGTGIGKTQPIGK